MNLSSSDVWAIFWIGLFSFLSILAICEVFTDQSTSQDDNEE